VTGVQTCALPISLCITQHFLSGNIFLARKTCLAALRRIFKYGQEAFGEIPL